MCVCACSGRVCAHVTRALSARTVPMHVRNARVGSVVLIGVLRCEIYKLYEI